MTRNQKTFKILLVALSFVFGGIILQNELSASTAIVNTAIPINAPIVDTLNDSIISPYKNEHKYAARVNDGLMGFLLFTIIGGTGVWVVNFLNKKQTQEHQEHKATQR